MENMMNCKQANELRKQPEAKKLRKIEDKAWDLVNVTWKNWNPNSPVLARLRSQWEKEVEHLTGEDYRKFGYTFGDTIA